MDKAKTLLSISSPSSIARAIDIDIAMAITLLNSSLDQAFQLPGSAPLKKHCF